MTNTINVKETIKYAKENPRYVSLVRHPLHPEIIKLNYTEATQYERVWNEYTRVSRGIVINEQTNEILALPFFKFFNYSELPETTHLPNEEYWVTEKLDGILIIPFFYLGKVYITTRGAFQNQYIDMALRMPEIERVKKITKDFGNKITFMFELLSSEARKVVGLVTQYDKDTIKMIGLRHISTMKLGNPKSVSMFASMYGLNYCNSCHETIGELLIKKPEITGSSEEGWVVQFDGGLLVKIKRDEYMKAFSLKKTRNKLPLYTLNAIANNKFDDFVSIYSDDDELQKEIFAIKDEFTTFVTARTNIIEEVFKIINKSTRKEFADEVMVKYPKYKTELFLRYDNHLDNKVWFELFYKEKTGDGRKYPDIVDLTKDNKEQEAV